jgi:hypothetical protein
MTFLLTIIPVLIALALPMLLQKAQRVGCEQASAMLDDERAEDA